MAEDCNYVASGYVETGYIENDCVEDDIVETIEETTTLTPVAPVPYQPLSEITSTYGGSRVSPGVILSETKVFSEYTYPVCTAILGNFEQGPIDECKYINTVDEFYYHFGLKNTIDSLSCLSFLQYAPKLLIKRVIGANSLNASTPNHPEIKIINREEVETVITAGEFLHSEFIRIIAQTPGNFGNDLSVALFTTNEIEANDVININYKAKDIIDKIPNLHYCVAVFSKNILIETFTVQFNRLNDINDLSNYVYCSAQINAEIIGLYDGDLDLYDGNADLWNGGSTLYDGNFGYYDGNFCLIDGIQSRPLFCVPVFIQDNVLILSGGYTDVPTKWDYLDAQEELENPDNYEIDLFIGNNCSLKRDDVLNLVPVPGDIVNAKDFVDTYDIKISTTDIESFSNIMFLYGQKRINKKDVPLAADYCGLRAAKIYNEGIAFSSSSINNPMRVTKIMHNPSYEEQESLWGEQINTVVKENGKIFCNGEILFRKNEWL